MNELLEEIAEQSGLTLLLLEPVKAPISIEFDRLSLESALHRILGGRGFALTYAQSDGRERPQGAPKPKVLWVFAKREKLPATGAPYGEQSVQAASHPEVAPEDSTAKTLLTSSDPWEREDAAEALGDRRQPEAIEVLGLALQDENEEVREAAIHALIRIGSDHAARTIAVALRDRDVSVRKEAIEALGKIGGGDAIQALGSMLRDEDPWLREETVEALGKIGGESAITLLQQALHDEDRFVRESAAEALTVARKRKR